MPEKLISELLDLPESVRRGDFVLNRSKGITEPDKSLEHFVVTPLLAGLDQLLPWIHQWHAEIDAEFGETAGQSFQTMLEHDAHELGLTLDDVRKWEPPERKGGRRRSEGGKKKGGQVREE